MTDCVDPDPIQTVLEEVFEEEVYEQIVSKSNLPGVSLLGVALKFLSNKSKRRTSGDRNCNQSNANDLLKQFGIKRPQSRRLCRFILCSASVESEIPELAHIHALATIYATNNGFPGVSFSALVQQYLHFHLTRSETTENASLIGGYSPRTQPRFPEVLDGIGYSESSTVSVNLSLLRGKDLVNTGPGPIRTRVSASALGARGFLNSSEENTTWLYHGTTIEHATDIVSMGPLAELSGVYTDFGTGFYVTNSLNYALEAAYLQSGGKSSNDRRLDPAVLAFPVSSDVFVSHSLVLNGREWSQLVQVCRRGQASKNKFHKPEVQALLDRSSEANCVVGSISGNAGQVDSGAEPHSCEDIERLQYAIKTTRSHQPMRVMYDALREGKVQLIRVVRDA